REVEEVVDARCREHLQLPLGVLGGDPGIADRLVVGQRDPDRKAGADLRPDRTPELEREPATVLDGPAVPVVAPVVERAQELPDEPPLRPVPLDPVEAARLGDRGRPCVIGRELGQLVLVERERRLSVRRRHARRPAQRPPALEPARTVALGAARDELGEEPRLERIEHRGQGLKALDLPLVVAPDGARKRRVGERRRRELLAEEEPDAPQGPLAVEREMAVGDHPFPAVLERRRGAHHPVRERDPPELQGLPERLEVDVRRQASRIMQHDSAVWGRNSLVLPAEIGYARPASLAEALELLASNEGARALAGGQTLVNVMKARAASPEAVVDLGALEELRGIELGSDGSLDLGAMTTISELIESSEARARPILGEVAAQIADVQVRNRGTIGGNICAHRPTNPMPPLPLPLSATP